MRALVIGSGGREHALHWKLSQSPLLDKVFTAPGNGGAKEANVQLDPMDFEGIRDFCLREKIDLVVPGPEQPLSKGIVDFLEKSGIICFGPDLFCARLEGSKTFAKEVMEKAGVPAARYKTFTDAVQAAAYIKERGAPLVIKADGLAQGKGVVVAESEAEALEAVEAMLLKKDFGESGASILIEEKLEGEEVSLLCFCDGKTARPLSSAQDHKRALDGDKGPNTGGMGAYSPAPALPDEDLEKITDLVIRPVLKEMAERGHPFKGILYAGLMITKEGPKVLEYNVRFGDPECQPLLMRLENDLAEIMLACAEGRLDQVDISFSDKAALGVVLAAEGYPGKYPKNLPITGLDNLGPDVQAFHAGTYYKENGLYSNGGRILCVTALGGDLRQAREKAYEAIGKISVQGGRFRKDIGDKGLGR